MRKIIAGLALLAFVSSSSAAQEPWKPAPLQLPTRWSKEVTPTNALPEYPRPQMARENWMSLNGLWEYAITAAEAAEPLKYDGQILVPYPLESALSGVQKKLKADQKLWYKTSFTHVKGTAEKILLHFGAVDNAATVFVNGQKAGEHKGGYTAFSFDITNMVKDGGNDLVVQVTDPTEKGVYPHGKQVSNPESIYYTSTSGIWQTVWMEVVPENYISALHFTPDIDKGVLNISVSAPAGHSVEIVALQDGDAVSSINGATNATLKLPVKNARLWSPEDPFLYSLQVKLKKGKTVVDEVTSYFGMRKVSIGKDANGLTRILLNNKYVYNLGTLDQGFWPDGLYTAPTDEALAFDIKAIRAMGFNTIRKHIKIEPARWYFHADKIGMLVWQDFVNPNQSLPEGAKPAFEKQLDETMEQLHNYPSVITWVLFNEKWGQYDQQRLTEYVQQKDPSRLLNAHSGEMLWVNKTLRSPSPDAWVSSKIADVHAYPDPMNAPAQDGRVQVLGEFGGIGVFIPEHQWLNSKSWGYIQVTPAQLLGKYALMNKHLQLLEKEGLSASIYTQPFDVEGEENGIITYDREVIKMPLEKLRELHAHLVPRIGAVDKVAVQGASQEDQVLAYSRELQLYIDGRRDPVFLKRLLTLASQAGDVDGQQRIVHAYISLLQAPLDEEDVQLVVQFTESTTDAGYALISKDTAAFRRLMGEEEFRGWMMNLVYMGEMKALIEAGPDPDWTAIENRIKPYGDIGEEIFLRVKTVHLYNQQNWKAYIPTAKSYLEKYDAHINGNDKEAFQKAIEEHE